MKTAYQWRGENVSSRAAAADGRRMTLREASRKHSEKAKRRLFLKRRMKISSYLGLRHLLSQGRSKRCARVANVLVGDFACIRRRRPGYKA